MPRKGENIYKRKDGRWEGRYIRSRDRNGKAEYGYIYGKTYGEVKNRLPRLKAMPSKRAENAVGQAVPYSRILDDWLRSSKLNIKESTYARYTHLIQKHIKPHLGAYPLSQLTAQTVWNFIAAQRSHGRLDGRGGLAPKTVLDILTLIKSTIAYADSNDYDVSCKHYGRIYNYQARRGSRRALRYIPPLGSLPARAKSGAAVRWGVCAQRESKGGVRIDRKQGIFGKYS